MASSSPPKNFDAFFWVAPRKDEDLAVEYSVAEVAWHYPDEVSALTAAFKDIPSFCFPDLETIRLETPLPRQLPQPASDDGASSSSRLENFTFILTDQDGNRVYGVCLRFLPPGDGQRFGIKRRPRHCLCFITRQTCTSLLREALLQVHALALLDPHSPQGTHSDLSSNSAPPPPLPASSHTRYFLQQLYEQHVPLLSSSSPCVTIPASPQHSLFHPFTLPLAPHSLSEVRQVAPLAEVLGLDTFFTILCAVLCERRVIFMANDVETLSRVVHAAAAMIAPFQWQHVFIPLLPSSLLSYAAAPVPYLIGVRRYLLARLVKEALEDVIIVDADTGDCTVMGRGPAVPVPNFFDDMSGGDEGGADRDSSSGGGSLGKLKAMKGLFKTSSSKPERTLYVRDGGGGSSCDQVLASISSELRAVWNNKPREGGGGRTRLGGSAADSSKDKWVLEFNKVLESNLLLLYVYFFGDLLQDYDKDAAAASLKSNNEGGAGGRGTTQGGQDFGVGDSRAAFDLQRFRTRRRTNGSTPAVEGFLDNFIHSQMFERFCADWVLIQQQRGKGDVGVEGVEASGVGAAMNSSHVYVQVCLTLRAKNLSFNLGNIRAAVKEELAKSNRGGDSGGDDTSRSSSIASAGSGSAGSGNADGGGCGGKERFHALALLVSSNSSSASSSAPSMSSGGSSTLFAQSASRRRSSVNVTLDCGFEYGYGSGLEEDFNQICYDAATSAAHCAAVTRTLWLRLEDCRMFNWKHGLRGLQLLHCMLLQGPPGILTEALARFSLIYSFTEYRISDSSACSADKRQQIRLIAGRIVTLLLDQKHLALRRHYGDQVRRRELPFVGLQKQLAARMTLSMQRDALATRATASMSVDKSYTKSLKSASRRLSSMNFGGDSFASQSAHPQHLTQLPEFSKKHAQYEQMMAIMQVQLTSEEVGVVQPLAASAGGGQGRAGHGGGHRASLSRRSMCIHREDEVSAQDTACDNLLDFDFDFENQTTTIVAPTCPQEQKTQQRTHVSNSFETSSDPFSDFDSTINSPCSSPSLPGSSNNTSGGGGFDDFFGQRSFSPQTCSTTPPLPPPQGPTGGAGKVDSFGFPVLSNSKSNNNSKTNFHDPFASFGSSHKSSSDPFASTTSIEQTKNQTSVSTSYDPFAGFNSSSSDPFSNDYNNGNNNRNHHDGFGSSFGATQSSNNHINFNSNNNNSYNNDILSLGMDGMLGSPGAGLGGGMQQQRSPQADPFAALSGNNNNKNNNNIAGLEGGRPKQDPFANIGGWK